MKALKNYLIIFLLMTITLLSVTCVNKSYAETITLEQIAEKFKSSDTVKEYQSEKWGYKISTEVTDDAIKIITDTTNVSGGKIYTNECKLQNGILSIDVTGGLMGFGLVWGIDMISCVGQLHGYTAEYMQAILNSDNVSEYTLENEGIEISETTIKINIEKMNLQENVDDVYITLDDLKDKKAFEDFGSLQLSKGYVTLYLTVNENDVKITIGEGSKLTERSYKSLCSVIEKIFDESVVDAFKSAYINFSVGNKQWEDFKIEINPEKTTMEANVFSNDSIARVTLDKSTVNVNTFKNNNITQEQNKQPSGTTETEKENKVDKQTNNLTNKNNANVSQTILPQTGIKDLLIFIVIGMIASIFFIIKLKKYKDIN